MLVDSRVLPITTCPTRLLSGWPVAPSGSSLFRPQQGLPDDPVQSKSGPWCSNGPA